MPAKPKNTNVEVTLPTKLLQDTLTLLEERGLTLSEAVRLHLRSMVTTSKKGKPLGALDAYPFGKYKDEEVGVIIRIDPDYVKWCLGNVPTFHLTAECVILLQEMNGEVDED